MAETKTISVEQRLTSLYELQQLDSQFDEIQRLKGELPIEVSDLEDEIEGLNSRVDRLQGEIDELKQGISDKQALKKESNALIEKYTKQQNNVKNNREFDALTKEIELQNLEIQIADKRIREANEEIEKKNEYLDSSKKLISQREEELKEKKVELDSIIKQTEKDEKKLEKQRASIEKNIEDRLLKAYNRIRSKYKNGLAVVSIERNACGGCFSSIPPQVQVEIGMMKRIVQCENCARILVNFDEEEEEK